MQGTTHPRLDEDAERLLREAARLLDAAEVISAHALLADDHAALVEACGHSIVCSSKARRLLSTATHYDLEDVA